MVANEKQEFLIHEPLFFLLDTGNCTDTRSIKTKVSTGETNITDPTKRLGEVDYTRGRIST